MLTPKEDQVLRQSAATAKATSSDSADSPKRAARGEALDENTDKEGLAAVAALPLALDQTVDSAAAGGAPSAAVSGHQFPVANWDRYEFLRLLGQGGMGAVYKARDRRLGRIVALKFIRGGDPQLTQRFLQEARAQSRIDHPGICKVFDVGEVDGKAYIVMQFVDGLSLHQLTKRLTLIEKVEVIKAVAEALHAAHEMGVIHRDIKPDNIMVERVIAADGEVRSHPIVMDFGLAREASEGKGLTESGAVMGTPSYMSPEQARGDVRHLDRRTDVYSLGATLYDLVSGTPPFEDKSVVNIILKVLSDDVRPLRQLLPELPLAIDTVVCKCLNKEAAQRYPSAQALADDLGRFLNQQRIVARRLSLWYRLRLRARRNKPVAALLVALLVALGGFVPYGIKTALQNRQRVRAAERQDAAARLREKLAKQLGHTVKDLEWLIRVVYGLALHDTTAEKSLLRARMMEVEKELGEYGPLARGLQPYVLGRGYLALHDWDRAYTYLQKAEAEGFVDLELDYALGRTLGALYSKKLDEARKSGDQSFVKKRQEELRVKFLVPALERLHKSQRLATISTKYVEALLDYYGQYYDAALLNAHMALQQQPWLYEAKQLEGDVFAARALDQKEHGDVERAESSYREAIHRYEQAAENGRSDYTIYESIAECWIRQEEMDGYRGLSPRPKLARALAAADQALEAAPSESQGWAQKAWAYYFVVYMLHGQQKSTDVKNIATKLLSSAETALSRHPDDAQLHDLLGNSYVILADQETGPLKKSYLYKAESYLSAAIRLNKQFPWAYNDLGRAHWSLSKGVFLTPKESESELQAAIQAYVSAISIDPNYSNALTNLSSAYQNLAELTAEHDKDPIEYVQLAVDSAKASLSIKPRMPAPYENMALAYLRQAIYEIDQKRNFTLVLLNAENSISQLKIINPDIASAYYISAYISYLRVRWAKLEPPLRDRALQAGTTAVEHCLRLNPTSAECHSVHGLLLAAAAGVSGSSTASIEYQKALTKPVW